MTTFHRDPRYRHTLNYQRYTATTGDGEGWVIERSGRVWSALSASGRCEVANVRSDLEALMTKDQQ